MTADERYRKYIAWLRLTHGGRRGREEMSQRDQVEWDALAIKERSALEEPVLDHQAIKRAYLAITV